MLLPESFLRCIQSNNYRSHPLRIRGYHGPNKHYNGKERNRSAYPGPPHRGFLNRNRLSCKPQVVTPCKTDWTKAEPAISRTCFSIPYQLPSVRPRLSEQHLYHAITFPSPVYQASKFPFLPESSALQPKQFVCGSTARSTTPPISEKTCVELGRVKSRGRERVTDREEVQGHLTHDWPYR